MKAYSSASATLKSILSTPALQRDQVDATMDGLADALADGEEINQAIEGNLPASDIDENELSTELNKLVIEKEQESEKAKQQSTYPAEASKESQGDKEKAEGAEESQRDAEQVRQAVPA